MTQFELDCHFLLLLLSKRVPIIGGHGYVSVPVSPSPPREPYHLPSGRHGLPRDQVLANQRTRIIEAVADVSSVAGYGPMTVEDVIVTAGISRRSFYDLFGSKEQAFLAAFDDITGRLFAAIDVARDFSGGFAQRVESSLTALLEFLSEHPTYADLCLVQVMSAGPAAVERRNRALQRFACLIRTAAEQELPQRTLPPAIVAEGIVGGIYEILYARVLNGRVDKLPELLPDLMYSALLPYVGAEGTVVRQHRPSRDS
jgi:AcrR family transcriptional regulator